jgi:hypothetical protein
MNKFKMRLQIDAVAHATARATARATADTARACIIRKFAQLLTDKPDGS